MNNITSKVLDCATKLANRDILKRSLKLGSVWYERVNDCELKFAVSDNEYLETKEIAEVLVKVFNDYGFIARTVDDVDDGVCICVEVQPFIEEFEEFVRECFNDDGE